MRKRAKIEAVIANARAFLRIQREFANFDRYICAFIARQSIANVPRSFQDLSAETGPSRALSKDLISRGFRFVGPKICYAFMQAMGLATIA